MNKEFRLDRTASAALSFEEADKEISQFHDYTWKERLVIANRLIAIAYDEPNFIKGKVDRTIFSSRKHSS